MFVLLRTKRMQLRNHADTQTVERSQRWKRYAICIHLIAFRMLEVRDHEIAPRKLSGGTGQLRILGGTLLSPIHSLSISRRESQAVAVVVENYWCFMTVTENHFGNYERLYSGLFL